MAYVCTDSGNLMAIAQQAIKQKQQQEQQQHQQHLSPLSRSQILSTTPPYGYSPPFPEPFLPEGTEPIFHFPNLDPNHSFRFTDFGNGSGGEFDSNDWMESLIGGTADSTATSSNLDGN
ncbi:hypothetical protein AgCh_028190 [Apium graveolens]